MWNVPKTWFPYQSFLECVEDPRAQAPDNDTDRKEMMSALSEVIASLPEREQLVVSLYYLEELNLKAAKLQLEE